MGTPPAPKYATVFYGVFELFIIERFGNNLLLYRRLIDVVLDLCKKYGDERNAAELRSFQETMHECYGLEWTFLGPFLKLDFMELTITIKENRTTTTLFEKNSIYTDTPHHIRLTQQESSI